MYGLLIENISQYIQECYGMEKWNEIRRLAQIEETSFNTHTIYPDVYTKNIIDRACQILKLSDKQLLIKVGESFVSFIGRYGYDMVLSALGREFRDFLNSLDDLHEYLRLSYPRLRPPSYFCDNENEFGLILHYRTKRNFLLWYTVGQIIKVAKVFYSTDVEIELLSQNQEINEYHFILQLRFDNRVFIQRAQLDHASDQLLRYSRLSPISVFSDSGKQCPFSGFSQSASSISSTSSSPLPTIASPIPTIASPIPTISSPSDQSGILSPITLEAFLDIFPFSIIYDSGMKIRQIGNCLKVVCPNIAGQTINKTFSLIKPKIVFSWDSILRHTNSTFELKLEVLLKCQNKSHRIMYELRHSSKQSIDHLPEIGADSRISADTNVTCYKCHKTQSNAVCNCQSSERGDSSSTFLKLKGQMIYFDSWKCIAFLGAPNVASLDHLIKTGLYLNDLSMHDFSRDMVLAGHQQSAELKLALDQELHKSRQLEITIKKLDEERRRSDELLYQMISFALCAFGSIVDLLLLYIPKKIADKLRIGEKNIETCQYFPCVTILFSDIINFTEICSKIAPMQVVNMLNETYTKFDQLIEKHNIYKVETIGDAYMVAGGLPVHQEESSYSHARKVCLMAMDMIESVYHIKDPSRGRHLKIRIGIHTGPVVGGIVGQKMPRYCLFGDTVNTSSRMETSSIKMRVQISEITQKLLDPNEWEIRERGTIRLKGKGMMKTYWLNYRKSRTKGSIGDNGKVIDADLAIRRNVDSDDRDKANQSEMANSESMPTTANNSHLRRRRGDHLHNSDYSLYVPSRYKVTCLII